MTKPVTGLNVFAAQTGPIPLSQLDADISALQNAINDTATYSNYYVDSSGAPNQLTVTTTAGVTFAYGAGVMLQVKIANTNTAAAVNINVNALGNLALKHFDGTNPAIGELVAGQVLIILHDGVNFVILSATTGTDVQVFLANGVWNKPAGGKTTRLIGIGAGCGGGSGDRRAAGVLRIGGTAGGGGARSIVDVPTSILGTTEAVTVAAGGVAGAAVAADNSPGLSGSAGANDTTFGAWLFAGRGLPSGGAAGTFVGGPANGPSVTGGAGPNAVSFAGGPSGACGGGITAANVQSAGGFGSGPQQSGNVGAWNGGNPGIAGGGAGTAGVVPSVAMWEPGSSGGGGGSNNAGAGGAAGASAGFGAGGSGGGASVNGNLSGAGAAGGAGLCVAITTR